MSADNDFEFDIVAGFLRVADYQVVDFAGLASPIEPKQNKFQAAILLLEGVDAGLAKRCQELRQLACCADLPIVAVLPESPPDHIPGVSVLVRPIRLFELAQALDRIMTESQPERQRESNARPPVKV